MNDFQRDAESRFGGTRFNLRPVTQDPVYPKDGDSWFRVDQGLIKFKTGGVIYGLALVDSGTGKLVESQTPDLAINEVFVVASEAEMLALVAQKGDIAVRTDSSEVFILKGTDPTNIADWQALSGISASVTSVNGQVGVVSLDTDDIAEGGTNLYYTDSRFGASLATRTTTDLAEGLNLYYTAARFNSAFAGKTTSDLTEGSNLYWTNARFDARLALKTTDNLAEGSLHLYYTDARFDARLATKTTSNLAEGSNLYYTTARFDTRFASKTTDALTEGATNLYYKTSRANADFDTRLAIKTTNDLAEGTSPHLYFTNTRADDRINLQKGVANGVASLDGSGKIPVSQLPGDATIDVNVVGSQSAMLLLNAQKGDVAKRTDTREVYVLRATPASTLSNWELVSTDYNANVDSVNGQTRTVSLSTSDVPEGTNLYYTAARFDTAFAAKTTGDLAEGANLYYTAARFNSAFAAKSTSDLAEGSNLYYTTARANADFDTRLATKSTSDLSEGTNLYYTTARANADFDTRLATKTTDNLAEGSANLYWTNARFDTRLSTKTTTDLAEGLNLYYTNARADARIALQKGAANGIATLDSGGKIPSSQLPAIAITDTFVVGSQVAMLALDAQTGDVAVRTDLSKTYILMGSDPTVLADWQELLTPPDTVVSVNGFTGAVTLTTSDVAEGTNLYYTTARANADFDTRLATKSTTNLAEGSNLYYTDARVRACALTGLSVSDAVVSASDSVLSAAGKTQGQINAIRPVSYVLVKSLSDLPAPVAGVITLADNTMYQINGTISFGSNTLVVGNNSRVFGISRQTDVLSYTGTGTFITVGFPLLMNDLGVSCPNGTMVSCAASSGNRVRFHRCQFSGVKTLGSITTGALFELFGCNILNTTTSGFTVSGTAFGIFEAVDCYLENNAGTFIALGSATLEAVKVQASIVKLSSGQTFLSGSSSVITFASVMANSFINSGGTILSGVTPNDSKWYFNNNFGLDDTQFVGECYMTANVTVTDVTVAGTFVKIAGTTTQGQLANFTMPANNRLQYNGVVTRNFFVSARGTFVCPNNNAEIRVQIFKNGVAQANSIGQMFGQSGTNLYNVACQGIVSLAPGDYIEVFTTNAAANNNDPTFSTLSFVAVVS